MFRILIGCILGGLVQFLVGAIAWGSPLAKIAFSAIDDATTADLQTALARTLTAAGTGTYFIPEPTTAATTALMGKGPVALIFFNTAGFPPMQWSALLTGFVVSIVMLLLIGTALSLIDGFSDRMRALVLIAGATTLYFIAAMPVYNFFLPWTWWIYLAVWDFVGLVAGGFVLLRWFMPRQAAPTVPAS